MGAFEEWWKSLSRPNLRLTPLHAARFAWRAAREADSKDAKIIAETLEAIDGRAIAADGPVTPTLREATNSELRSIYRAAKRIQARAIEAERGTPATKERHE